MKKLILELLILILISGCTNTMDGSAVDLYAFFDTCDTPQKLILSMQEGGFVYGNDLDDVSYVTDAPVTPETLFKRKYGNCQDYAYFYAEFCKRKGLEYKIYILRKGWNWHYIIFTDGLCLSNISYSFDTLDNWYNRGYEYQKEIK